MADVVQKSFDSPDEVRTFPLGNVKLLNHADGVVGLGTFEPGWRWSEHLQPIVQTPSCQANHTGYVVSGRATVLMDDGQEFNLKPGDFFVVPGGHDAWTVGDEPCVMVDWQGLRDYAKG